MPSIVITLNNGETKMNKKQITDLINDGWYRLDTLNNVDWRPYRDEMLAEEVKDERKHRQSCPFDIAPKFSVTMVAKWFVLRAIWGAKGSMRFTASDILHCKHSYLMAHAINDDDRFDLYEMFNGYNWEAFLTIGYSQADLITEDK